MDKFNQRMFGENHSSEEISNLTYEKKISGPQLSRFDHHVHHSETIINFLALDIQPARCDQTTATRGRRGSDLKDAARHSRLVLSFATGLESGEPY